MFFKELGYFLISNLPTYLLQIRAPNKQQKQQQVFLVDQISLPIKAQVFSIIQAQSKTHLHHYLSNHKPQSTMMMMVQEIALNFNKLKKLKPIHKRVKSLIHMMTAVQFYLPLEQRNSRRVVDNLYKMLKLFFRNKNNQE